MMLKKLFKSVHPGQPASVEIKARRVDFRLNDAVPYNWYAESSVYSFLNAVTMLLPVGERFFIDSVLHYRDRINDPQLLEQIAGFVAQEAAHSRQHELLNKVLLKDNPRLIWVEDFAKLLLGVARLFPARHQLAITCALEHFTASFANVLFSNYPAFRKFSHPAVSGLWAWHAVEELEHKSVCFDVYQAVAGGFWGYIERCLAMLMVTTLFSLAVGFGLFISIVFYKAPPKAGKPQDGKIEKTASTKSSQEWGWLVSNVVLRNLGFYLAYFRPSFHPWDCDDSNFVATWQAAGAAGVVKNTDR